MSNLLTANRLAAIAAFLTGLAAAIAGMANTLPKSWQSTVLAIVGLLGAIGTALHFMLGSQNTDKQATALQLKSMELEIAKLKQPPVTFIGSGGGAEQAGQFGSSTASSIRGVVGSGGGTSEGQATTGQESDGQELENPSGGVAPWWKGQPGIDDDYTPPAQAE